MKRITTIVAVLVAFSALSSCVDHRPLRNYVPSENVYLPKQFLTRENPHKTDSGDRSWLLRTTVIKTSMPDSNMFLVGDNAPPRYVRFQLKHDKLEMVDDEELAPKLKDSEGNETTSPSLASAVINAWPGEHVDIRMRDNLQGERTNVIEENKENDWEKRQYFKADLTEAVRPDVNMLTWYNTDLAIGDCAKLMNVSLVPDSVELEEQAQSGGDDYLSWTVEVTYELAVFGGGYWCGDVMMSTMDRTTFTTQIKYSLWRVPERDYKPVEYAEKDPTRKKLMAFETGIWNRLALYYDPKTDLVGAKSYMNRLDPEKPHTFYFDKSFPEKYKAHFKDNVAKQVNDMAKELGIAMRIDFKDWNAPADDAASCSRDSDCPTAHVCREVTEGEKLCARERSFGDVRYSVLTYHEVPWNYGPIGMAYHVFDPRTGELLSTGFNMYKWPDHHYANLLKDYIKQVTKDQYDGKSLSGSCTPGDVVKVDATKVKNKYQSTSLYAKLTSYMNQPPEEWVPERMEGFGKYMRMLLSDLRYAVPGWNQYVWHSRSQDGRAAYREMLVKEREFQKLMASIDRGESPFGTNNVLAPGAIEKGVETIRKSKEGIKNHFRLRNERMLRNTLRMVDTADGWELAPAMARSGRKCKANGKWETESEWVERVIDSWWKIFAVHEFGHSLGLRHNFYGSMDKPNMEENSLTSSIMEYAFTLAESAEKPLFHPHDMFSLRYIYGGVDSTCGDKKCDPGEHYQTCKKDCEKDKSKDDPPYLFCTDEHTAYSPLCTPHDIGTRPTEIIKNAIDHYEWMYKFRNFRAYRKFWNTSGYTNRVANTLYPMRRFLHLWGVDWYASNIKNNLTILGVKGDELWFDNLTDEFNDELGRSMRLVANFYKAILQQSAAERSYATKFDNFYGDVTQQGIIMDKYYAMLLFLGLWPIDDYDQNIYAYMAFHEYSLGNSLFYSDSQDAVDSMIGGQYDVYPWFKPLAVMVFAQDTGDINFSDRAKQNWIEMKRFSRLQDMIDYFGFDPRTEALKSGNDYQVFKDKQGAEWIYYYLQDRNEHLVSSKDKNPTAYKILWDQNEDLNVNKFGSVDDYEIKYYCDYYHYFN